MKKKWAMLAAVVVLVPLPLLIHVAYRRATALPRVVTVATGSEGGLYRPLCEDLADELERRLPGIEVRRVATNGSLDNLLKLQAGEVDFALYQPETLETYGEPSREEITDVAFVANLYSQPAHFIVHPNAEISGPDDLRGKRVALGLPNSGDYAMSTMLLNHFGLDEEAMTVKRLGYAEIVREFEAGTLDAAFVTVGVPAPIFRDLLAGGKYDLIGIPYAEALATKHVSMSTYEIPPGFYRSYAPAVPPLEVETVALSAQLLTRIDTDAALAYEVTELVLDERFSKQHQLRELFEGGHAFAREKPLFPVHPGAQGVYDPEFDMHSFESWEALYSLVASTLIAAFLATRWLRRQRLLKKEHRLDRYMRSLLEIERRQITLDGFASVGLSQTDDRKKLQELLDEVTHLRQDALRVFTAHELSEDRAADCLIEMCHALSNKINAKLSRQRLDKRIDALTEAIQRLGETDNG